MTKAVQERVFVAANILNPHTRFVCVRYGNVLASRGSVIPLFHDQIRNGGPVTITSPEMTRFLLSLDDAVDTVFAALKEAKRGETYVPRAPSATVMNVARALIGDRTIDLQTIGVRPGEKLHEILISEEEVHHCVRRGGYYAIQPMLPELRQGGRAEQNALEKEYSSADDVLDLPDTIALLKKHRLMVDEADLGDQPELLR
jgi:UDP-glucose 4-epimerase